MPANNELASHQATSSEQRTIKLGLRLKALETLGLALHRSDIKIDEVEQADDFLYGQLMGCVMIYNPYLKITFKIHFSQKLAEQLTAATLGIDGALLPPSSSDDFMREYCNLAAGYMADWLARHQIPAVISIPLITDGFDEVWFSDRLHPLEHRDYWQLTWPGGSMACSASFIVHDESRLAGLEVPSSEAGPSPQVGVSFL